MSKNFSKINEYKWTLIFYQLELERDFVAFNSVKKERFSKYLIHLLLQLYQYKDNEKLFFEYFIQDEKIINKFKTHYNDIYDQIFNYLKNKTYGVTSYLKDCISGLVRLGLLFENPAIETMFKLNLDLLAKINNLLNKEINVGDDIEYLITLVDERSHSIRPNVSNLSESELIYENN